MQEHRDAKRRRAVDHRHRHKATFGEHQVRPQLFEEHQRLARARDYLQRVGQVFQVKIAAKFSGGHGVVADARQGFNQPALDAIRRADVMYVPPFRE